MEVSKSKWVKVSLYGADRVRDEHTGVGKLEYYAKITMDEETFKNLSHSKRYELREIEESEEKKIIEHQTGKEQWDNSKFVS